MRLFFLAATVATSLVLSSHAHAFDCPGTAVTPFVPTASTTHDHLKYAPAIVGSDKAFRAYHAVFDNDDDDNGDGTPDQMANPTFVAYELKGVPANSSGNFVEPDLSVSGNWYRSDDLAHLWAAPEITEDGLDHSYRGIGAVWNRGHLAMNDHAQRIGAEPACNTFHFWNASPQAKDLNQGPWRHLENYTAAAANQAGSVWIITGPIFDLGREILTIGDDDEVPVAVPHAFFKIVVRETPNGPEALGFIFEQPSSMGDHNGQQQPLPDATWIHCNDRGPLGHIYDHSARQRPLTEIAWRTGLELFASRPPTERFALMLSSQTEIWDVPSVFWQTAAVCGAQNFHP